MKTIAKHIIYLLLLSMVITSCNSNDKGLMIPKSYYTADSLRTLFETDSAMTIADELATSQSTMIYADVIRAWCYCYTREDSKTDSIADIAIAKLDEMAESVSDPMIAELTGQMEMLSGFANIAVNPQKAISNLERSIEMFKTVGNVKFQAKSNLYLSEIYKNMKDPVKSLHYLYNIEEMCDTVKILDSDPNWVLDILSDIANMATENGDNRLANQIFNMGAMYYDAASLDSKTYYLYQRLKTQVYQGEYKLAIMTAEKLEKLTPEEQNYDETLYETYILHSLALYRSGKVEESTYYRDIAENMRHKNEYKPIKETILLDGELAAHKGQLAKAHFLLFDTIKTDTRTFGYNMILESQKSYFLAKKDYQSIYELQQSQNQAKDSLQLNVVMKSDDDKLNRSRFAANEIRKELIASRNEIAKIKKDRFIERLTFGALLLLTISWLLISIQNSERHFKRKIDKEHKRLEDEIADKMAELKHQKEMLQITNNRISQSITYAEHIQHSIIPSPDALESYDITGSFIFYSPLDIVSGDFYWFTQKGDHLIVCCADCTGHGVPGAFMSMIASTALNDICNKHDETIPPSQILELLDEVIIATLGQNQTSDGTAHDGCDISVVSINLKDKSVKISSAKRPVIVIRDQEMIQVTGTKRSIGDTEPIIHNRSFTDTEIQLHTNDVIYMYSDGYSDQFGGKDGSKMKNSKIKGFLRAIHDNDMDEQGLTMQDFFTQWKGDHPQTDDVLFMGIKI